MNRRYSGELSEYPVYPRFVVQVDLIIDLS